MLIALLLRHALLMSCYVMPSATLLSLRHYAMPRLMATIRYAAAML